MTMQSMHNNLRTFYTIIITQTLSMIGSRMTGLAIAIYVFQDTGDVTPLGLISFFMVIPQVVGSGLAGVMADRRDRRQVMIFSDFGQALATIALIILFATDALQIWHVYIITLIQATFGVFQWPALQASITMLVPDEQRDRANAIMQISGPAAGIVGPVLAGILFAIINVEGVMLVDLVTFMIAVGVIAAIHIPRPEQTDEGRAAKGSVWQESNAGLRWMWKARPIFYVALASMFINFVISIAMTMNTPYILTLTDNNKPLLGLLLSISSVGGIAGGIIIGVWGGTRPRMKMIVWGLASLGLSLTAYGISRSPLTLGLSMFLFILPLPIINAGAMSIFQAKIPPDLQGRVFAALQQMSILISPIAFLIAGPLADFVFEPAVNTSGWRLFAPLLGDKAGSGMGLLIVVCGILLTINGIILFYVRQIRDLEAILPDYENSPANPTDALEPDRLPDTDSGLVLA
jgi:MFS family permease